MISFLDVFRLLRIPGNEMPNQQRVVIVELTEAAWQVLDIQARDREVANGGGRGEIMRPLRAVLGIPVGIPIDAPPASSVYGWRAVDAAGNTVAQGMLRPDRWTLEAGR